MTTHEINLLIERYLDGATTPAEERELALAVQREDRPAEWAIIAEMLGELTLDEARYGTAPNPSERGESLCLLDNYSDSTTPLLWRGWGRSLGWGSSAAAACAIVAFGLSYNIIKDDSRDTTKVEPHHPIETQQEPKPVLVAREEQPCQPLAHHNKPKPQAEQPLAEVQAPTDEPLPEEEPLEVAEVPEVTPPEDIELHLALLDELLANIQQQSNRPELSL